MAIDSFICVGTFRGLSFSIDKGKSFSKLESKSPIAKSWIESVIVSRDGSIFAGTDNGLYRSSNLGKSFTKILDCGSVKSINIDEDETIYVGTFGAGFYVSRNLGESFETRNFKHGIIDSVIRKVFIDIKGNIYACTDSGLLISKDKGESFKCKDLKKNLNSRILNLWDVSVNHKGVIHIVTSHGLFLSDDGGENFLYRKVSKYEYEFLSDHFCILTSGEKSIYVGSVSMGLHISHDGGESFINITKKEGLGSNRVLSLAEDYDGIIYACTDKGLSVSYNGGKTFENKNTIQGLCSPDVKDVFILNQADVIEKNPAFSRNDFKSGDLLVEEGYQDEDEDENEDEDLESSWSQKRKTYNPNEVIINNHASKESGFDELKRLIGLDDLKKHVEELVGALKGIQLRSKNGIKTTKDQAGQIYGHYVFSGPPGTGKTTVARIMAKIFKEIGILKRGHLVEVSRTDLVSQYTGETAIKTRKKLISALDGVLFIDEAYSLAQQSNGELASDSYGPEAVNEILKFMEDNRERVIVIIAGYENEIKNFIESNPGLKSRFKENIKFKNYTSKDLLEILDFNLKKSEYNLEQKGRDRAEGIINEAILSQGERFGNVRFVRDLQERIIRKALARISKIEKPTELDLRLIIDADF